MFVESGLIVAGVALFFVVGSWIWYLQVRKEYRRFVGTPRLTVRALLGLRELPEWVVLEARTGAGTVTAPLSSTGCAWYRVTAGRTRAEGDAASEVMFSVMYTGTSYDSGIPLVDVVDVDAVVWLSGDLAASSLGSPFPALTTLTVDERVGIANSFSERDAACWRHLEKLKADGHLSGGDLTRGKREGRAVVEEIAPADTPVLVLGKPRRQDSGIVTFSRERGGGTRLEGVTTWPDSQVRRRFAVRLTVCRRLLVGSLIMIALACGWMVGWIAILG